jgi:hypothetical protein
MLPLARADVLPSAAGSGTRYLGRPGGLREPGLFDEAT